MRVRRKNALLAILARPLRRGSLPVNATVNESIPAYGQGIQTEVSMRPITVFQGNSRHRTATVYLNSARAILSLALTSMVFSITWNFRRERIACYAPGLAIPGPPILKAVKI